jgi:hypothetical protein
VTRTVRTSNEIRLFRIENISFDEREFKVMADDERSAVMEWARHRGHDWWVARSPLGSPTLRFVDVFVRPPEHAHEYVVVYDIEKREWSCARAP